MSDMLGRLPTLGDDQLTNLRANAERLGSNGTKAQQKSATELLPAIDAEIAARKAAKPAPVRAKPASRKKKVAAAD